MAGKGDTQRPRQVTYECYVKNWEHIFQTNNSVMGIITEEATAVGMWSNCHNKKKIVANATTNPKIEMFKDAK